MPFWLVVGEGNLDGGESMSGWVSADFSGELRGKFIKKVDSGASWFEIWQLFANNEWYLGQLSACAAKAVAENGAPSAWIDDVIHDAILLLARQLRRSVSLGYEADRPHEQFGGWLRTILFRNCHEAIRTMRRRHGRDVSLDTDLDASRPIQIEQQIDIRMAIDDLSEPARTILLLDKNGLSLREISNRLDLTYWQVQHARQKGLASLRSLLQSGYDVN